MVFEGERESQANPWRRLLADNISEVIGEVARREIIPEEDTSSFPCDTEGNVRWTRTVTGRMDELMDEEDRIDVLTRCAHVMPESSIRVLREICEWNDDVEELREF